MLLECVPLGLECGMLTDFGPKILFPRPPRRLCRLICNVGGSGVGSGMITTERNEKSASVPGVEPGTFCSVGRRSAIEPHTQACGGTEECNIFILCQLERVRGASALSLHFPYTSLLEESLFILSPRIERCPCIWLSSPHHHVPRGLNLPAYYWQWND